MHTRFTRYIVAVCLAAVAISTVNAQEWKAKPGPLKTEWGKKVTPENAWTEYPRPHMVRKEWTNLNGLWDYAITKRSAGETAPASWQGKILVPYPIESQLSGVKAKIWPNSLVWYKRTLKIEKNKKNIYILHFGAVDYECILWINGKKVGEHVGGNTPFRFDITEALKSGDNELILRVYDRSDQKKDGNYQLIGKQTLRPSAIRYEACTGIWQTTWLEEVPAAGYIDRLKITTAHKPATIKVQAFTKGKGGDKIRVTASFKGKKVAKEDGPVDGVTLSIENAKLWSPDEPNLYDLKIELLKGRKVIDSVDSYAGVRTFGKVRDANGHYRFTVNDKVVFHWGPLDQGWWPDGLLTPPSDEAMLFDLQFTKDCGFNMIRPHIKVNPMRYYYYCDKLGLLVWQDHVSGTLHTGTWWSKLRKHRKAPDKKWPKEHHDQFMAELKEMIDELYNYPSICSWIPFNESWAQHDTMVVGEWTMKYDPTRLMNIASGGNFYPIGDIADGHAYPDPYFPLKDNQFKDFIKVIGEWGGYKLLPPEKNRWNPKHKKYHGYGGTIATPEDFKARLKVGMDKLLNLKKGGIAGAIYTQVTDVENEINGLLSYDRVFRKITEKEFNEFSKQVVAPLE